MYYIKYHICVYPYAIYYVNVNKTHRFKRRVEYRIDFTTPQFRMFEIRRECLSYLLGVFHSRSISIGSVSAFGNPHDLSVHVRCVAKISETKLGLYDLGGFVLHPNVYIALAYVGCKINPANDGR